MYYVNNERSQWSTFQVKVASLHIQRTALPSALHVQGVAKKCDYLVTPENVCVKFCPHHVENNEVQMQNSNLKFGIMPK